jgi:hypothetical protein
MNDFDTALSISLPVMVKAVQTDGRRVISVQASSEAVDAEGDVIRQCSLLGSAKSFLNNGHIDIDHISEIGARFGVVNPSDYIIGKPLEAKDIGGGRTEVIAELFPALPGATTKSKADTAWESILAEPTVWKASIYGFPTSRGIQDCRITKSSQYPSATRYIVSELDWKSLALTKTPVNGSLGSAQILTMKSFAWGMKSIGSSEFAKAEAPSPAEAMPLPFLPAPRNRLEMRGHYYLHMLDGKCPCTGPDSLFGSSVAGFREHYFNCCGLDYDTADILALVWL